jgi:molybdenum cofactor cytidylyltransferase
VKFGPIPVAQAAGTILAHSIGAGGRKFRKAHLLTEQDCVLLAEAGIVELVAVRLDEGDVGEDEAADAIVAAMTFSGISARPPATGRVNLHADSAGVFSVDADLIDAINAVYPAITVATLPRYESVEHDQMVATVKIIPYAVAGAVLQRVLDLCRQRPVFRVDAYRSVSVGVIQTTLPGLKDSILDKTARVTQARLERSGSRIVAERRVAHDAAPVAAMAAELARTSDMVVIFGASAVSDFDDVIPAAIREAGGTVIRTGAPVDPGNLLVLGRLQGKPVIGAPGCSRSPKENSFDWVLDRLLAGIDVSGRDIAGMGVGGLLMEIASRPQPREVSAKTVDPKVFAIVLAAGRSSRMGGPNKLMAMFDGKPLVRRTAERAMASAAERVLVVTGHQSERVVSALAELKLETIENPDFASGLSSSLRVGVAALPEDAAGALIVLGDMPGVSSSDLDRMIAAFRQSGGQAVVRATHFGKRGNPVILPRRLFAAVAGLEGDTGARHLIEAEGGDVVDVELGEGASLDVDTPEAMAHAGGVLQG